MSELFIFVQLGFRHITDLNAMDHILFLIALAAIYRPRDWRSALWVVTAFTVGHSITLAMAVSGAVTLPTALIEFLIPVTIVATCAGNILNGARDAHSRGRYRPLFAGVFGLVHGAGFANYLRDLFADRIATPLLGFNIGIEIGQVVVLGLAAIALVGADRVIRFLRAFRAEQSVLRVRVLLVSTVVMFVAVRWAVERNPW